MTRFLRSSSSEIAGVVYGTIVTMGAITAGTRGGTPDAAGLAGIVAGTVLVLWLAHVYSDTLAESISRGRRLDRKEFLAVAREELAIPLAAVVPIGALVLGAAGLFKESTAIWLAMIFGLLTLAVEGIRYATVERLGAVATIVTVGLNVALGLIIVGLKAGLGH